ncbi:MAG: PD40 domain-containing protein, partial [Candidatus Krumholzibacteria bacterium]|nr:PD40 domain-containing protein [Candidatus Krumholzibacteria bacterium]
AGRGFFNHFPVHLGTDGRIVYISNCGGDYSDLRLVCEYPGGRVEEIAEDVTSRFSLSPDGKRLCYSKRTKKNKYGYSLNDLFVYDFVSGNEKRLTRSLRATDPAWSPDGKSVACVFNKDGSDRIVILNVDGKGKRYVTSLVPGRQYFGLSWGKKGILASKFDGSSRDIELVDPESGTERVLISSPADERDPCWDEEGAGFLYSSDRTGIFNIYYRSLVDSLDLMVTHGLGGTFGPSPAGSSCLFSYYGPDGFEIREIPDWRNGACKSNGERDDPGLMNRRIDFIAGDAPMSVKQDAGHKEVAVGKEKRRKMALDGEKFGVKYTPIYVFPRLLIYERKARIGIFLDSRDLIDRQSVFAGGSINDDKEFDLNLGFELRQFKPTFSFEVYRSRKYYTNTIYIDGIGDIDFKTRYDLWDAFFTCRMELVPNTPFRRKEIALQYNHGEYGLNIEAWDPFNQELGWNYYKANEISIVFHYRKVRKEVDGDINPRRGRTLDVQVTRAYNKLSSGDFEYAFLPIYDKNHFGRYTLAYEEFVPIPFWSHAMSLRIQGGALDSSEIDDFFYLYLGSRDGLRGYSYYSLGGRKVAMARLTYRFPLLRRINRQIFHIYLSSIYAGLFAEAGKAWNEDGFDFQGNKKDVGFELRVKGFSFYNFPLAASMEAAYGLDDVKYTDPFNKMLTFYEGNKWKFYGSVLFNF